MTDRVPTCPVVDDKCEWTASLWPHMNVFAIRVWLYCRHDAHCWTAASAWILSKYSDCLASHGTELISNCRLLTDYDVASSPNGNLITDPWCGGSHVKSFVHRHVRTWHVVNKHPVVVVDLWHEVIEVGVKATAGFEIQQIRQVFVCSWNHRKELADIWFPLFLISMPLTYCKQPLPQSLTTIDAINPFRFWLLISDHTPFCSVLVAQRSAAISVLPQVLANVMGLSIQRHH